MLVLLVACSGRPVAVDPPSPTPDAAGLSACQAFSAALPDRLETIGQRRTTRPDSALTAAYGDPPASIRCGVPTPAGLSPTATLVEVDGVSWYPEELTEGWAMTTVDLVANVEIVVPTEQGPAPSVAADLAATIRATLPPA